MASRKAPKQPPDVFYTMPQVAQLVGWPVWKVRRWLRRSGIVEKRYGTLVVSSLWLGTAFPELQTALSELERGAPLVAGSVRFYTVPEVAKLMRFPVWKARRWMQRQGIAEKRHGTIVTTLDRIGANFPELFGRYRLEADE
jgi:hypothetical protein